MRAGDVVLVRFPFSDVDTTKKRPALVLARTSRSTRNTIATVAMITSQVEGLRIPGDTELMDWRDAGLLHPSILRIAKVATIDGDLVDRTIGRLSPKDHERARDAFQAVFRDWIP